MTSSSSEIEIISSDSSSSPKQIPPEVITDVFGACAYGDLAKLRILVEKEGALLTQQDGNGYYPLQWAALNNFADAIHYHGGDVDAVRRSVAAADVLLQNAARVEAVDVNGHRAIADLTKSLEFEPDSADILHERGIVNFKIKDFKAATEDLSECVKLDKDNKSAYTYLGLALSSLGEYKKAEEAHLKAIQIDQNFLDSWGHLAQFYQDLASSEKALDCLEKALKIDDRFAKGYHLRGLLLHAMGDHRKAIKDLSVGLRIESSNIECLYLWASCHHAVGEYKEAVKDYDAALDLELDSMDKFVLQCLAFYQGDVYPVEYNYNCIMDQVLDAHWGVLYAEDCKVWD